MRHQKLNDQSKYQSNQFSKGKENFSKAKISEAWKKYKEEGGALSNKEKS